MTKEIHKCECEICRTQSDPEVMQQHQQMNLLLSHLNEPQRRWYVGSLSQQRGQPTDGELSQITGLDEKTIRRERRELDTGLAGLATERQRQAGGGAAPRRKKAPSDFAYYVRPTVVRHHARAIQQHARRRGPSAMDANKSPKHHMHHLHQRRSAS